MRCPFCGYEESKVIDSRPTDEGASIPRLMKTSESEEEENVSDALSVLQLMRLLRMFLLS